jgi:hypothetical protein
MSSTSKPTYPAVSIITDDSESHLDDAAGNEWEQGMSTLETLPSFFLTHSH